MAIEPVTSDLPGWYGKLSTLGDFAHRRLPQEVIDLGDAWLSQAMNASRQQLGERWLDVYLHAPMMRFAWAPGVADAGWWFGVLMPSCDNVGRYFPLLIAYRRARPPLDRIALDHLEAWFDHLANAATHTLGDASSIDSFEDALCDAPPWPTPGSGPSSALLAAQQTAAGERFQLGPRTTFAQWLNGIAIDALHTKFSGCSIWWRKGQEGFDASATVVHGLPDPASFADMLAGH